ncbi:Uncharacterised protein [Vibrio cholerae]|nr:Uncharacterised protein [Vibrio cholerae]
MWASRKASKPETNLSFGCISNMSPSAESKRPATIHHAKSDNGLGVITIDKAISRIGVGFER